MHVRACVCVYVCVAEFFSGYFKRTPISNGIYHCYHFTSFYSFHNFFVNVYMSTLRVILTMEGEGGVLLTTIPSVMEVSHCDLL